MKGFCKILKNGLKLSKMIWIHKLLNWYLKSSLREELIALIGFCVSKDSCLFLVFCLFLNESYFRKEKHRHGSGEHVFTPTIPIESGLFPTGFQVYLYQIPFFNLREKITECMGHHYLSTTTVNHA